MKEVVDYLTGPMFIVTVVVTLLLNWVSVYFWPGIERSLSSFSKKRKARYEKQVRARNERIAALADSYSYRQAVKLDELSWRARANFSLMVGMGLFSFRFAVEAAPGQDIWISVSSWLAFLCSAVGGVFMGNAIGNRQIARRLRRDVDAALALPSPSLPAGAPPGAELTTRQPPALGPPPSSTNP